MSQEAGIYPFSKWHSIHKNELTNGFTTSSGQVNKWTVYIIRNEKKASANTVSVAVVYDQKRWINFFIIYCTLQTGFRSQEERRLIVSLSREKIPTLFLKLYTRQPELFLRFCSHPSSSFVFTWCRNLPQASSLCYKWDNLYIMIVGERFALDYQLMIRE